MPKDVAGGDDDDRLELVYKQGKTFWIPAGKTNNHNEITNFWKWEKAFRVFSDIYARKHPGRASELIQYNHLINTAALTYAWDNVYLYDKDFRRHMS